MPDSLISLAKVNLSLKSRAGAVDVLRDIDLSIGKDQSVAVVGPSGSGKTSLLMVMAGLERATSGEVHVAGHDFGRLDEDQLARIRGAAIGIVFQSFHLVPTMTALENVALPLELRGERDARQAATELLREVGLGPRLDHFPAQLSGGEQQRVALARALVPKPRLILADEPTGNLDGTTGRHIVDLLFTMRASRHATLVLVTHDDTLANRCQRLLRMADGRIVADTRSAALPGATVAGALA